LKPLAVKLVLARRRREFALGRGLFLEYSRDIGQDLGFQDFSRELDEIEIRYGPSDGGILLLRAGMRWAGCAAIRRFEGKTAELKRMYVRPGFRGRGFGRLLAEAALARARRLGYEAVRLDTLPRMKEAADLYRSLGFRKIGPYRFNPVPGAEFFEVKLERRRPDGRARPGRRTRRTKNTPARANRRLRGG
jgi:GNAT superfamily N-acetyltransferase